LRFDGRRGSIAGGECNCGAVQFEIDAELHGVFVCRCSICRRATGSTGIAVLVVPYDKLRWSRGEEHITTSAKPNTSWQICLRWNCGSPMRGRNDPTTMFVPAGSIAEGGEALRVIHHVWAGLKAGWDEIGDAGKQHTEAFRG
jgi:hypothetical protein